MRRSLGLLSSAIPLLAGAAWAASLLTAPVALRFEFTYPTNAMDESIFFILHGAQNVSAPLTNWPVDAVFPATNWYFNGQCVAMVQGTNYVLRFTNSFAADRRFLYIVSSNEWGQYWPPSNVFPLGPAPAEVGATKVQPAR